MKFQGFGCLLLQALLTTVVAKPALGRHSHRHRERSNEQHSSNSSIPSTHSTQFSTKSTVTSTGVGTHETSSSLVSNGTVTNQTWLWQDPASPRIVEDIFELIPYQDNVTLPGGNVSDFSGSGDINFSTLNTENFQSDGQIEQSGTLLDLAALGTSLRAAPKARVAAVTTPQRPKVVFAHFMVGNVPSWTVDDWKADIRKAQAAHIDAFALNMASDDPNNTNTLNLAFFAAAELNFTLAFSFDYAGGPPWEKSLVLRYIDGFAQRPAYYHYNGKAFMSTFEGWENAADWVDIKKQKNVVFLPDWSSRGAKDAMGLAGGVADGLFSWAAWPWGNTDMNTYVDASYIEFLSGKLYMMPVSPWFYTNMPGFDGKNWIWRGDSLWHDRWAQTLVVQPDFVQIISWNDFGESHYIGPLNDRSYSAFGKGLAPYNYVLDMPHDGWRDLLPFAIDIYKYNTTTFNKEILVTWYRKHPAQACTTGGTSGSTASQLLLDFAPSEVAQDMIFYSALLASDATPVVTIGGVNLGAAFQDKPSGGIGLYHGSVATGGRTGAVSVSITRSTGNLVVNGKAISTVCEQNIQNYNAWVGSTSGPAIANKSPALAVHNMECIRGTGPGLFTELCEFTCKLGYCPLGACQCLEMGKPNVKPASTGIKGYPQIGMTASFEGLCDFGCNLGKCPTNVCRNTEVKPYAISTVSPFLPPACNRGTGKAPWAGLCSYTCDFGYCPLSVCSCNRQGVLNLPPASDPTKTGYPISGEDGGLCKFACSRTWCPSDVCEQNLDGDDDVDTDYKLEDWEYLPDCTGTYNTIDDVIAAGTQIPFHCYSYYMVLAQANELGTSLTDYNALMKDSYDSKFAVYSRYISDSVWPSIKAFMTGDGRKYLKCTAPDNRPCCHTCLSAACGSCRGTMDKSSCDPKVPGLTNLDCPTYIRTGGEDVLSGAPPAITFSFTDKTAFFKDFEDKYGIPESWTKIGSHRAYISLSCVDPSSATCYVFWQGLPVPADTIAVPNPKTTFSDSLTDLTDLQSSLIDAAYPEGLQLGAQTTTDVMDAADLPVAMTADAIVNMRAVVAKANEIAEQERKSMILFFLTSLLMVIPAIGSGVGALGMNLLRNIIRSVGVGGEAALAIWTVVNDPDSALITIFSALAGVRDYTRAARSRRSMSDKDLDVLGTSVAAKGKKTTKAHKDYVCAL